MLVVIRSRKSRKESFRTEKFRDHFYLMSLTAQVYVFFSKLKF